MALKLSTMLPLGTQAPNFRLLDPSGKEYSLDDFQDAQCYLIAFMCNHCPYVKHVRNELARLGKEYQDRGLAMIGINSNNIETHPQDSPEMMAKEIQAVGYTFPYLFDESQATALAYTAPCTPDFFLFDQDRKLIYRGQLDSSRPDSGQPATGKDIREALDCALTGKAISTDQKPSQGCNIKWKPGNEPSY